MAASSLVGGTLGSLSATVVGLNAATWTRIAPVTVDFSTNVGIASNNDGSIENNTGKSLTVDFITGIHARNSTGTGYTWFAPAVSTDGGTTWTPITDSEFRGLTINSDVYNAYWCEGTVTLEAGDILGFVAKQDTGTTNLTSRGEFFYARSRDGGASRAIDALTSYVTRDGFANNGSHPQFDYNDIGVTTNAGAISVGVTDFNNGRLYNNTGETKTVDGYCVIVMGAYNGINPEEIRTRIIGAGNDNETAFWSDPSPVQVVTVVFFYSQNMSNGSYITAQAANWDAASRGVNVISYQHRMWSRD